MLLSSSVIAWRTAPFVLALSGLIFVVSACVSSMMISHRSTVPSSEGSVSSLQRIDLESRFTFSTPTLTPTGSPPMKPTP